MKVIIFIIIVIIVLSIGSNPEVKAENSKTPDKHSGEEGNRLDMYEQKRQKFDALLASNSAYQTLIQFEKTYYADLVSKDREEVKQLPLTSPYYDVQYAKELSTIQGRLLCLEENSLSEIDFLPDFLTDYAKNYPNASLTERREAVLTRLDVRDVNSWVIASWKWSKPNYFMETKEDVEVFFSGRKPNNGRRLILVEKTKDQLHYFGFSASDVQRWDESKYYGQVVYIAYNRKEATYQLVYRLTEYDRFVLLTETFDDYVVDTLKPQQDAQKESLLSQESTVALSSVRKKKQRNRALEKASRQSNPTVLSEGTDFSEEKLVEEELSSELTLDSPRKTKTESPAIRPSWYEDIDKAIQNDKLPILRDGRDVRTIDWLTEPSLPVFSGIDVYRFATDLDTLGNIMMIVGKHFVGQPAGDWIRFINEKSFGRKRMTKGYQQVYRRALLRLEERQLIRLRQGIVSAVATKEEPVLITRRLPKALQNKK